MPISIISHSVHEPYGYSPTSANKVHVSFSDPTYSNTHTISLHDSTPQEDVTKISSLTQYIAPFVSGRSISGDSGILPPGLLYLTKNYLVFEKPPCYQTLFVIPTRVEEIDYDIHEPTVYRLPIPWQLYIVAFSQTQDNTSLTSSSSLSTSSVRMHFMNSPLMSLDQEVYMAPLNNFYTTGDLCRPMFDSMDDLERYSKDVAGVMQSAYDWIWNSGTNLDLTDSVVNCFIQFKNNTTTSVFTPENLCPRYIRGSYYCTYEHLNYFYSLWEKIPLHEVSNLDWPSNSHGPRFHVDHQDAVQSRLSEYLSYMGLSPSDDYCDDCAQYVEDEEGNYDYDSDPYHYDECECSCHDSPTYDMDHFLHWAGLLPSPPIKFCDSFRNFVVETKLSTPNYKGVYTHNAYSYQGVYRGVIDQVLLNS